eukprot:2371821-Rhodomonas_salina.2
MYEVTCAPAYAPHAQCPVLRQRMVLPGGQGGGIFVVPVVLRLRCHAMLLCRAQYLDRLCCYAKRGTEIGYAYMPHAAASETPEQRRAYIEEFLERGNFVCWLGLTGCGLRAQVERDAAEDGRALRTS